MSKVNKAETEEQGERSPYPLQRNVTRFIDFLVFIWPLKCLADIGCAIRARQAKVIWKRLGHDIEDC
jgi:hypothetical protein